MLYSSLSILLINLFIHYFISLTFIHTKPEVMVAMKTEFVVRPLLIAIPA